MKSISKIFLFSLILSIFLLAGCSPHDRGVELFSEGYHIDGNQIWYRTSYSEKCGKYFCKRNKDLVVNADVKTFQILSSPGFGKDKDGVYRKGIKIDQADPQTFQKIDDSSDPNELFYTSYYYRDKNHIFYEENPLLVSSKISLLKNADVTSFKRLPCDLYARDQSVVYFNGMPVKDLDAATFKIINCNDSQLADKNGNYKLVPNKSPQDPGYNYNDAIKFWHIVRDKTPSTKK